MDSPDTKFDDVEISITVSHFRERKKYLIEYVTHSEKGIDFQKVDILSFISGDL